MPPSRPDEAVLFPSVPLPWEEALYRSPWCEVLDPTAGWVYTYLRRMAYRGGDGRNTHPAEVRVASACHISISTLRRTLRRLAMIGLVLTYHSFALGAQGAQGANLYVVFDPVAPFHPGQKDAVDRWVAELASTCYRGWTYSIHDAAECGSETPAVGTPPVNLTAPKHPIAPGQIDRGAGQFDRAKDPCLMSLPEVPANTQGSALTPAAGTPSRVVLRQALNELGIQRRTADELLRTFGDTAVAFQLAALRERHPRDPAATLVAAVKGAWGAPPAMLSAIHREHLQQVESEERAAEDRALEAGEQRLARARARLAEMPESERNALEARAHDQLVASGVTPDMRPYTFLRRGLVEGYLAQEEQGGTP